MNKTLIYLKKHGLLKKAEKAFMDACDFRQDMSYEEYLKKYENVELMGSFTFIRTEEGQDFWWDLTDVIRKFEPESEDKDESLDFAYLELKIEELHKLSEEIVLELGKLKNTK